MSEKTEKKSLIEFERDEFVTEVTENWSKWKNPTKVKEIAQYMIDNAFTKKAIGTLEKLTKEQLREIILNGDEDAELTTTSSDKLSTEITEFLEDVKIELHQKKLNNLVKKQFTKLIDKFAGKISEGILNKLGIVSLILLTILMILELIFPNGFKDLFKKIRDRKKNKADNVSEAEVIG